MWSLPSVRSVILKSLDSRWLPISAMVPLGDAQAEMFGVKNDIIPEMEEEYMECEDYKLDIRPERKSCTFVVPCTAALWILNI